MKEKCSNGTQVGGTPKAGIKVEPKTCMNY